MWDKIVWNYFIRTPEPHESKASLRSGLPGESTYPQELKVPKRRCFTVLPEPVLASYILSKRSLRLFILICPFLEDEIGPRSSWYLTRQISALTRSFSICIRTQTSNSPMHLWVPWESIDFHMWHSRNSCASFVSDRNLMRIWTLKDSKLIVRYIDSFSYSQAVLILSLFSQISVRFVCVVKLGHAWDKPLWRASTQKITCWVQGPRIIARSSHSTFRDLFFFQETCMFAFSLCILHWNMKAPIDMKLAIIRPPTRFLLIFTIRSWEKFMVLGCASIFHDPVK